MLRRGRERRFPNLMRIAALRRPEAPTREESAALGLLAKLAQQVRVDPASSAVPSSTIALQGRNGVRSFVRHFLTAAAATLDLDGPVAVIRSERCAGDASASARRQFGGKLILDCQVPARASIDSELSFAGMPIEPDSLRTMVCVDLLCRFEETAEFFRLALPWSAPGGIMLLTADVSSARPHAAVSRVLTPLGLERLVADLDGAIVGWTGDVDFPDSLLLVACRSPVHPDFAAHARSLIEAFQHEARDAADVSWPVHLWRLLSGRGDKRSAAVEVRSPAETTFSLHVPRAANWKDALVDSSHVEKTSGSGLDMC